MCRTPLDYVHVLEGSPFLRSDFAVCTVLVGLYEEPERPTNAVDYIKRYMGAPTNIDVEAIKAENDSLKKQVQELTAVNGELQKQVRGNRSWLANCSFYLGLYTVDGDVLILATSFILVSTSVILDIFLIRHLPKA